MACRACAGMSSRQCATGSRPSPVRLQAPAGRRLHLLVALATGQTGITPLGDARAPLHHGALAARLPST
jgi:hypothetical protein